MSPSHTPLKKPDVAAAVDQHLTGIQSRLGDLPGVIGVELHRVTSLEWSLRIKTHTDGTHYYRLKLSEAV